MSAVHRGTIFEERSLNLLRQDMSMSLQRVGGKHDGGIDLLGWWWLPHDSESTATSLLKRRRIRIIGQCKAEKKKVGPNYIRELEGVLFRLLTTSSSSSSSTHGSRDVSLSTDSRSIAAALLVSESSFTKSTILRANSSPLPFVLLHLPSMDDAIADSVDENPRAFDPFGRVGAVWCNPALVGSHGLLRGRMEVRWERHSQGKCGRPALWWDGIRLASWVPEHDSEVE